MRVESLWQRIGAIIACVCCVESGMTESEQSQAQVYRERASIAEARAAAAATDSIRDSWLSIAHCYREMAERRVQTKMH